MRVLLCLAVVGSLAVSVRAEALEAEWSTASEGVKESGLRLLDGADGAVAFEEREGSTCATGKPGLTPPSQYLYFDVLTEPPVPGTVLYVTVEYLDVALGRGLNLEYDSTGEGIRGRYSVSDDRWGGWMTGSGKWQTAVFLLERPRFGGGQNLGADFRFGESPLFVRRVRVSAERPAAVERLNESVARIEPRVKIGEGGELIIGGFDPDSFETYKEPLSALERAIPSMKAMGVTSHEGYVRWNLCEPEPGRYDWSVYDAFVDVYRQNGLKWVPFLIVGSAYSLPGWYYKQPESQGYVCLEHGQESDVQSLWNPALREHVARFIKAFCEHYGPTGVIESILLGVTGNYGEAIYVASGNDWTASVHGEYHTHGGFWAGDKFAVEDFRGWLKDKYGDVEALNAAWGRSFAGFDAIAPFLRKDAPNDRAWLDFCDWYIGSMTDWSRFWMGETRKNFAGPIYLCTGGHAPAEHGADFGDQCKLAAEVGGGVRITNEASDYAHNFTLTRWVASAGRQYGAYFSFEPAGLVTPEGVVPRIYNATASGARGLHYYYPNIFGEERAVQRFELFGAEFRQRKPRVEIAVYYPQTFIKLTGTDFIGKLRKVRDRFDFDYMSDGQILDGGLKSVKALVLIEGNVSEASVWGAIQSWTNDGGLLVRGPEFGAARTVEGTEAAVQGLLDGSELSAKGRVVRISEGAEEDAFLDALVEQLSQAPELSEETRGMVHADGRGDKCFVTLLESGERLWLNATPEAMEHDGLRLEPGSIATKTK